MKGMIMMARMMPADKMPMPTGGPETKAPKYGTPLKAACNGCWTKRAKIGPNTMSPHMPYTMEGTAANNSMAVPKGRLSQAGESSVKKSAIPKLTGTAISKAMAEVARVLRPGGHFLYADLRGHDQIAQWEEDMKASSLREVSRADIIANVQRGLEKNSARHTELIARHAPKPLRKILRDISGVQGQKLHQSVEKGELVYLVFDFVKD